MQHQTVNRNQPSQNPLASGVLQHQAVQQVPENEEQPPIEVSDSGFEFDFSQVPVSAENMSIQAKLTVGAAGDKYEQEADQVAAAVVNQLHNPASASGTGQPNLQREEEAEVEEQAEEEELQMKPTLQRMGTEGGPVSDDIETEIQNARGSGQALAPDLQAQMGQAMGADFSGVRVHTDTRADVLNRSVGARAFTTGQDVFFKQGEYQPGSKSGQELIAHELTHVKQQTPIGIRRQGDSEPSPEIKEKLEEEGVYVQAKRAVSPTQQTTYIQRAYTARRPLGGAIKGLGNIAKNPWFKGKGVYHEHIFFEDGEAPPNWGFMGKNGCGQDEAKHLNQYTRVVENLADNNMRTAVNNVGDPGAYSLLGNNCQRYVQQVLAAYRQL